MIKIKQPGKKVGYSNDENASTTGTSDVKGAGEEEDNIISPLLLQTDAPAKSFSFDTPLSNAWHQGRISHTIRINIILCFIFYRYSI